MYFNRIYFIFGLLLFNLNSFSQTASIDIVSFNSTASYGPGSGVSLHINPTGIFEMGNPLTLGTNDPVNNKFVLELSNPSGDFSSPTVLAEVYAFYTPLINGLIPEDSTPGTDDGYQVRVKATLGWDTITESYDVVYSEAMSLNVVSESSSQGLSLTSGISNNINFFSCDLDGSTTNQNDFHNPVFGSLNRILGASTSDTNIPPNVLDLYFIIEGSTTYNIKLIDILNNGANNQVLTYTNPFENNGVISLPEDLGIGTYSVEIEQISSLGISSFYSATFLWHSDNTNLGNTTTESVCLGTEVNFAIDITEQGISRNYLNSYYSFNFGDGEQAFYTHAQLIFDNSIAHTYDSTSCDIDGSNPSYYVIQKKLFNDFWSSEEESCGFFENGLGKNGNVNVSEAPAASFTLNPIQCETSSITAINTTLLGEYGTGGECLDTANFTWYYKEPGSSSFNAVNPIFQTTWLVGDNLVIPSDFVNGKPGCWEIYLTANNPDLCQLVSAAPVQTVSVETTPLPDFDILFNGEIVSEICTNYTVLLNNTSNVSSLECQNPAYQWTIFPSTGFSFVNDTTASSSSPQILFNIAGTYTITQTITNTCDTVSVSQELLVEGAPFVEFTSTSDQICRYPTEMPFTVDFSTTYIPLYSDAPYAPSSYSWSIGGTDISALDYSFVSGTDSSSPFPVIEFNSFKDYIIILSVNGDCEGSNSDEFTLILNEIPEITNTELIQTTCSGSFSDEVLLFSSMEVETTSYSWEVLADENFISGYSTPNSGNLIPSEQLVNSCNLTKNVIYRVTPSTEDCTGSPVDFTVIVNPTPVIPDQSSEICSGDEFFVSPLNSCPTTIVPLNTTYTWVVSSVDSGILGATDQSSEQTVISQVLINELDVVQFVTYSATPVSGDDGSCIGAPFDIVVTVNPKPIIDDITLDPICSGGGFTYDPTNNLDNVVPLNTTYNWTVSVSNSEALGYTTPSPPYPTSITQSNLTVEDEPVIFIYTVTPTSGDDGNCIGEPFDITIQVNPKPIISSVILDTICSGEGFTYDPANDPDNNLPSNTTYDWTVSVSNPDALGYTTPSPPYPTSITQSNLTVEDEPVIFIYTVTPTSGDDGNCVGEPFDITITVVPNPVVSITTPLSDTICIGGTIDAIEFAVTGGIGTQTNTWSGTGPDGYATTESGDTPWNPGDIFTAAGSYEFYVTVDFDGSGCNQSISETVTITVLEDPVLTDPSPLTQQICLDSSPECLVGTATGGGEDTYTFNWYLVGGSGVSLLSETAVTESSYCPPTDVVGTFEYYYTVTTDLSGCETTSLNAEVIVTPGPSIADQPLATQTVCKDGATIDLEVSYQDGIGDPTYQWYVSNVCDTTDLTNAITDATSSSYTPPSGDLGTFYYFAVLTFSQGGCDAIVSDCAEVIVTPNPVVSITTPLSDTICIGGTIDAIEFAVTGGIGTQTNTWSGTGPDGYATTESGDTPWNPGDIFTAAGSYEFYVTVDFDGSGCNQSISETVTITVLEDPVLTDPSPLTQQICLDSSPECLVGTATGGGEDTYTFNWYLVGGSGVSLLSETAVTESSYCPPTDVVGTFEYYYTVTTDLSGCETTSLNAEVIVTPGPSIADQPLATQTVCKDGATIDLEVSYQDGIGDPTYQWYVSNVCDTTDLTNAITDATSSSYTPPSGDPGTFYYFAVLTFSQGGCDAIVSDCAEVIVKPVAEISDQVIDICDVSSYVLNPQDGLIPDLNTIVPSGTTYTWSFVDNTNIDGENSVSESLFPEGVGAPSVFDSGILDNVNPLYDVIETVEFNVTPWTDGCSGPPFTIIITISPEPEINAVVTNTECSYSDSLCGGSIEISTLGMVPFTYNWTSITPGVIISNPTEKDQFDLCPGIYMLNIIDSSGCSYDYEYEINQPVPINFNLVSLSGISCNNVNDPPCDGFIEVSFSGGTLPYTSIEWFGETAPGSGIFTVGPFTNTANPFQLFNACEGRYHLEVIDANGCQYISDPYIIEQLNTPIILSDTVSNFNGFNIDCNGANTGSISVNLDGGSETYNYSLLDSAATIIYQGTLNSAPASISFEFLTAGDYSLTISDPICPFDIVVPYTLTQPDPLSVSATLIDPINCFGGLATYNIAATGGVPPYTGTGFVQAPGGSITFTIYDSNGCSDVFTTTVPEPAELASTSLVTDALCFGDLGSLAITPNGGVGVLTVSLFDASLSPISNQLTTTGVAVQFNVLAGTYFYKIEDASGCETNPVVSVISEPQILEVTSLDITNLNCNLPPAFENGSICITIIGGTNPFPLGSGWVDNGGGNWCLTGLSEGTYPIDVTDQNGCPLSTIIPDIELTRPEEITAFFKETIDIDCTSNTAIQTNTIVVDGGIPPYEITWSGGVWDPLTQELMETSVSGNYTAFVNDQFGLANGCPPIAFPLDPIVFFEFGVSDFSLSSTNSDFCGVYAIGDPINFQNNSTGDIVDFTWNFGDGSLPISGVDALTHIYNLPGTYTIELALEDMYGCLDIFSETIKVTRGYEIILPTAFTPNGDGINETIRPVFNCITTLKMSIYDTFGSLLYEEKGNTINGWDGTINGNQAENGNYIIVVSAESFNGEVIELSGPITLIK
ncbi:PKD domain-containing protein [Flavobacteriaceae bacterium]|nr:PKD domain-containing protein [Flavobacteriaceae bacterium]